MRSGGGASHCRLVERVAITGAARRSSVPHRSLVLGKTALVVQDADGLDVGGGGGFSGFPDGPVEVLDGFGAQDGGVRVKVDQQQRPGEMSDGVLLWS